MSQAVSPALHIPTQISRAVAAVPLYVASSLVTLAGIGAVGVTVLSPRWTTYWAIFTLLGHLVSFGLRLLGMQPMTLFFPVMTIGAGIMLKLAADGSPLAGMEEQLTNLPLDMATATLLAIVAAVRSYTLVTNGSLLFSAVPAIAMLALVGSSNPNAEILLFFGIAVLGALFTSGYEAHLARSEAAHRRPAPVLLHLLAAWAVVLIVAGMAAAGPYLIQPALSPFSPFAFATAQRLQNLMASNAANSQQAAVGQGPVNLSPAVLYEIYSPSNRKFRTGIYSIYTGKSWLPPADTLSVGLRSTAPVLLDAPDIELPVRDLRLYRFKFPSDPQNPVGLKPRRVRQVIITRARTGESIPSQGWIVGLNYPQPNIVVSEHGMISGNGHVYADRVLEVESEYIDVPPSLLRRPPPAGTPDLPDGDYLTLPQSSLEAQELARQVVRGVENRYDRIQAIIRHIESSCRYTLQGDYTPQGEDAVVHYLFRSRRGACDLSATAAAVMCRAAGIPSRVVTGYVAEEPLITQNGFLVRQEHAHMWFECYFPGYGWIEFDPAPPSAEINDSLWEAVTGSIQRALSRIGGGGLDAALLVAAVLVTLLLILYRLIATGIRHLRSRSGRRRAAGPAAATAAAYRRTIAFLARRGWRREPAQTPAEFLEAMAAAWEAHPQAVESLRRLTSLQQQAVYAMTAGSGEAAEAAELSRSVMRSAPRNPQGRRPEQDPRP